MNNYLVTFHNGLVEEEIIEILVQANDDWHELESSLLPYYKSRLKDNYFYVESRYYPFSLKEFLKRNNSVSLTEFENNYLKEVNS